MGSKKDDDDLSFLEEGEKSPVIMIMGGVILLVVIVILCVVIWQLSHKKPDNGSAVNPEQTTETSMEDTQISASQDDVSREPSVPSSQAGEGGDVSSVPESSAAAEGGRGGTVTVMTFHEVNETVTAKEAANLRSQPSTESDDLVVVKLKNGETVTRTGLNDDTGWSRLDYQGQTVYALSRLLTTDLSSSAVAEEYSKPAVQPEQPSENSSAGASTVVDGNTVTTKDGKTVTFHSCDDIVSPKMEVNLRGEPSTAQGNDSIHYRLKYGETVRRTGYQDTSDDTGWSRVEYNGETLYAVTSYLFVVEETAEGEG